jgi:hypothetical protein
MRIRLDPQDEYMHALGPEKNFNESMYFNVYDPNVDVGAWFRLGNRANEGYAEMTTCVYLPGGPVGFMYARPPIDSNGAFDAGGMQFEVVEPFKQLRVSYGGTVALLEDPLAMKDPRAAFEASPHVDCAVECEFGGLSPMWGGEPELEDGDTAIEGMNFARGHYEQHIAGAGRIRVGADAFDIDGFGIRDHSWGPRSWQAPWWYRWLTCNAGPADGFMVSIVAGRSGSARRTGMVFENGGYTPILDASIDTEWVTEDRYHRLIRCVAKTPDREIEITGSVKSLIPLRNRRGGEMTRISEGLTQYNWEGKTGYGLSEYLDQIVDGIPVGE